jgi:phosphopantothenoylcysteine decarboxylase/phosphopantothenate--cysteine ligase
VVAPATANIIAKMAAGIADEVLSTQLLTFSGTILLAPAMNVNMWNNSATQRNIAELNKSGIHFVGPTKGHLANLTVAEGRMNEPEVILKRIIGILKGRTDLAGVSILVTAGPTIEPLDPVRFISNYSSGKMGYAVARAASERGAEVTLISGPVSIDSPPAFKLINVETASQMKKAVSDNFKLVDAVVMAAAVADFRPKVYSHQKIKKGEKELSLALVKNPDILEALASKKGKKIMIGFALETENLRLSARKKMQDKNLDMIIANDPTQKGVDFGSDFNKVVIFRKGKRALDIPLMPKTELAHKILDELALLLKRGKR